MSCAPENLRIESEHRPVGHYIQRDETGKPVADYRLLYC